MFHVQIYNNIATDACVALSPDLFSFHTEHTAPDVILLRSEKLTDQQIPASVLAVGRAGAGVNNIPVTGLSDRGIPVFNTPGANANAVKELVLLGLLLSARSTYQSWTFLQKIIGAPDLTEQVEKNKKTFRGIELLNRRLSVLGLGHIGVSVANACRQLGMHVTGYDPSITVKNAWMLDAAVTQKESLDDAVSDADFVTAHIPYNDKTHHLIGAQRIQKMTPGCTLLNFSRGDVVDHQAVLAALETGHLKHYVTDFPHNDLLTHPQVTCLPHLGASTAEAELNCATMLAEQIHDYMTQGHIRNAVNLPNVRLSAHWTHRLAIINDNIPSMVAQISQHLSENGCNILDMINKSRDPLAYTLIDIDQEVDKKMTDSLRQIEGVRHVRYLQNLA